MEENQQPAEKGPQKKLLTIICMLLFLLLLTSIFFGIKTMIENTALQKKVASMQQEKEQFSADRNMAMENEDNFRKTQSEIIKNVQSNKDLPDIAKAAISYATKDDNHIPIIEFVSNDGEYAIVSFHQVGVGGGSLIYLVKRNNQWIAVMNANGIPSCETLAPMRIKYNLSKAFIKCGYE